MTIKITTANGGSDSLDFGCAQTAIVATVTGTEVSSGEGKLEFKTTTGGTSATKVTIDGAGLATFTGATTTAGTVTASGDFLQGTTSSSNRAYLRTTANWNFSQLDIQRNASNTANFKAISFRLDGDTDSDTNLYNYPNIIINTDSAPTTGDTSVLENASLTINTPSTIRFGTNGAERMRITAAGLGVSPFTAKAWVNMNGTGTPAITDSHNISSITDNATGEYRVVLGTALAANDSGAPVVSAMNGTGVGNDGRAASCSLNNSTGITVSVGSVTDFSGREDVDTISVVVFGD
jgi:hypothetical protein